MQNTSGGRVVQGGGRQIHAGVVDAVTRHGPGRLHRGIVGVADGALGHGLANALGSPGGAPGVHHLPALALVGDGRGGHGRRRVGHRLEDSHLGIAGGQANGNPAEVQVGHRRGRAVRHHHGGGAAVVEHVLDLRRGQVVIDRGVDQPGQLGGPQHRQGLRSGLRDDGQVVARRQPPGPQQVGQSVGLLIEHPVGDRLARPAHDHGGMIGCASGEPSRMQHFRIHRVDTTGEAPWRPGHRAGAAPTGQGPPRPGSVHGGTHHYSEAGFQTARTTRGSATMVGGSVSYWRRGSARVA